MIKRYYWNQDIDENSFHEFLAFQNELTEDDSFEVWLDSDGGDCITAEMLKSLFESYSEDKFKLIATGRICSAAFDLFVTVNCNKFIIPGTLAMTHTVSRNVKADYRGTIKSKATEYKIINNTYPIVDKIEAMLPKILTSEEMEMYNDNQDIWLTTEEIKKFLT